MLLKSYLALTASTLVSVSALAADYYVAPNGTGDYSYGNPGPSPLAAARLATATGDVIHMACGTYVYSTPDGELMVKPGVTIEGGSGNPEETVIERMRVGNNDRVVCVGYGATLRNLTLRGGYTDYQAGGIMGYDDVFGTHQVFSVSNCIVENCTAAYQGGGGSGGTWRDCIVRNCQATAANETYRYQACNGWGGGIMGGELYGCVVSNCWAFGSGGGVAGGTDNVGSDIRLWATNCTFSSNATRYENGGGAAGYSLQDEGKGCFLYDCTVSGNEAKRPDSQPEGTLGGGISRANAVGCLIVGNYSLMHGGGTHDSVLTDCVLRNNAAYYCGGAGYLSAYTGCTLDGNVAEHSYGGATYDCNTRNCAVFGNRSGVLAALCHGEHVGDIVCFNYAWQDGDASGRPAGGSACGAYDHSCKLVNCTIFWNEGGTVAVSSSELINCIVWGQAVGGSFDSATTTLSHCFLPDGEDISGCQNCKTGTSAGFVIEKSDDYLVNVYALRDAVQQSFRNLDLKYSSPCRNAGVNQDWMRGAFDVFGTKRLREGLVDIGAVESTFRPGLAIIFR